MRLSRRTCSSIAFSIVTLFAARADAAHPSLYYGAADVAAYRAGTTGSDPRAEIFKAIDQGTRGAMRDGTTCDALGYAPDRDPAIVPFAVDCMLTNDKSVCDWAKAWLLCVTRLNGTSPWESPPDLTESGYLSAASIGYDILSDASLVSHLSASEQAEVRKKLASETKSVIDAINGGAWWKAEYLQNHNWSNFGAIGMAAIVLHGELSPDPTCDWLSMALDDYEKVDAVLRTITDGTWHEGYSYEGSSLAAWARFPIALRRANGAGALSSCPGSGGFPDLTGSPQLQAFPHYRALASLPGKMHQSVLLHGDFFGWSSDETVFVERYAAARHKDSEAAWLAENHLASQGHDTYGYEQDATALEYLVFDPSITPKPPTALDFYLADLAGQISRSGYDAKAAVLGVKVGAYGGLSNWKRLAAEAGKEDLDFGHDHEDDLGFAFYANGEWLAPEEPGYVLHGFCTGSDPEMHQTKYHNALTIDDVGQIGDDVVCRDTGDNKVPWTRQGSVGAHTATQDFSFISMQGAALYPSTLGLDDVTRQVLFLDRECVVTRDHLHGKSSHDYQWYTHALDAITRDGTTGYLRAESKNDQALAIRVVTPADFTLTTSSLAPPHGPNKDTYIDKDLDITTGRVTTTTKASEGRFLVVMCPTTTSGWSTHPKIEPLGDVAGARGFSISRGDSQGNFAFGDAPADTSTAGDVVVIGVVGGVETTGAGSTYLLIDGTSLSNGGKPVLTADAASGSIEAKVTAANVELSADGITRARIFAPTATTVTLNGAPAPYTRDGDYVVIPANGGELDLDASSPDASTLDATTGDDAGVDGAIVSGGDGGSSGGCGCVVAGGETEHKNTGSAAMVIAALLALVRRRRRS